LDEGLRGLQETTATPLLALLDCEGHRDASSHLLLPRSISGLRISITRISQSLGTLYKNIITP